MKRLAVGALMTAASLVLAPGVWSYQAVDVKDGGTISGSVRFKGTAPAPKKLDVNRDVEVCGKKPKIDRSLLVSDGNLVNAVVTITDIQKGKKPDGKKVVLDQKGCEYNPHVLAFMAGTPVEVLNPDGVLHNVNGAAKINKPFNLAQPKFRKSMQVKIDKPETIPLRCDVHAWMDGWLVATPNPYFSVTDKSGSFKLTDVPPGTKPLVAYASTETHSSVQKALELIGMGSDCCRLIPVNAVCDHFFLTVNGRTDAWSIVLDKPSSMPFGQGVGEVGTAADRAVIERRGVRIADDCDFDELA
jgi:plastocyanin